MPRSAPTPTPTLRRRSLARRFATHLAAEALLPDAGVILLVAVSGGADSMVLWDLLARLRRWPLVVYHLDHGLRAEAPLDALAIQALATTHAAAGLPPERIIIERTDLAALARRWRCSLETAGRRHRYARLRHWGLRLGAAAVLTAHHRDDQAETVLANLLRGAGPVGRAGISPRRILAPGLPLVRPLLSFTRAEVRAHAAARRLPWREDATNRDQRFHRNFLRHAVLPTLERGAPGIAAELATLAAASRDYLTRIEPQVRTVWREGLGRADLRLEGVLALPQPLRGQVWRTLLQHLRLPVARGHIRGLDSLAHAAPGRRLALGPWLFLRRSRALAWELARPPMCAESVELPGPGDYRRAGEGLSCREEPAPVSAVCGPDEAFLARAACAWPLVWRPQRPGERWRPLGCPGHQTVVKFLSTRGVASQRRPLVPVVADRGGILWVPGHTVAERARVRPSITTVIHLRWNGRLPGV